MLHVVFGAGLVGCFLGTALARQGIEVKFVARGQWQVRLTHDIVLTDYEGNRVNMALPSPLLEAGQKADVIWLTTKCTALASSLNLLKKIVHEDTVIICCQNGVGAHKLVQHYFPTICVARAMVPFNVIYRAPNIFHKGSEGSLTLETLPQKQAEVERRVLAASHPIMQVQSTANMDALQWAKLQLNLGNSVNALANLPVRAMLEQRSYRQIIALAMEELLTVVDCMGISLPKITKIHGRYLPFVLRTPDWLFKRVAKQMLAIDNNVKTSMWWDIQAGKPTEIDYLNGAVVAAGMQHNIPCPVNIFLLNEIKKGEQHSAVTGEYEGIAGIDLLNKLMKEVKKARPD
ncbi:2-dehydropantoate 2-reductase [Alteromonas ponticola]|uniref:2-dehydropantoate 2-reductase n=1 Tax=Alteromonas aquimaris TaxID=2998417 RepID=A0ABT3P7L2_9ALTE|nr:2-dehydropantoate 2-reductase [Alteromonas aquimaris]MCW8108756.1 2-dehydropantoate 2-reductase [Alteromonas aquimaris]